MSNGKNAMSAVVSTFEVISVPNQTTSSGVIATFGIVCVITTSGNSALSSTRDCVTRNAHSIAATTASANPRRISCSVTHACSMRLPSASPATSDDSTSVGAGTSTMGTSKARTTTCQTTSTTTRTPPLSTNPGTWRRARSGAWSGSGRASVVAVDPVMGPPFGAPGGRCSRS